MCVCVRATVSAAQELPRAREAGGPPASPCLTKRKPALPAGGRPFSAMGWGGPGGGAAVEPQPVATPQAARAVLAGTTPRDYISQQAPGTCACPVIQEDCADRSAGALSGNWQAAAPGRTGPTLAQGPGGLVGGTTGDSMRCVVMCPSA